MKTPSVEPVLRSRLLPRISFRVLFALTTLGAIIAAVARAAGNGGAFASAILISMAFLLVCFLLYVILFLIVWSVSSLWYVPREETAAGNPFAEGQLPPQIMPPREQRS